MSPSEIVFEAVTSELHRARIKFSDFHSAHEGYAVLLEEVDELWEEVKKSPAHRDVEKVRSEAIQVAAMAIRLVLDCCDE